MLGTISYASSNDYVYSSDSLVGIEGGYASFDTKDSNAIKENEKFGVAGLKIGAQTHNVRMFLSFRNAFVEDYDYAYMYGGEIQYKFNFSSIANFYIGANIGRISFRFEDPSNSNTVRDFTTKYVGGDVGFNFHVANNVDLELGARLISIPDPEHTLNGVTYTFDDITMGYMSIIFKYQTN